MYEFHDMRHRGFPQVDGGQRDTPRNGASQIDVLGAIYLLNVDI